jgi:hypothetical protein
MKNILITLVLVVLSTIGLGQTPFRSLTIHIDTVQIMSWELGLDYKTAKDQNKIKNEELYLFNHDFIVDLISKTVTVFWVTKKTVSDVYKLKNFKVLKSGYFFEFWEKGNIQNYKMLICKNVDETYSEIEQSGLNEDTEIGGGQYDRNVKITIK